MSAWIGAARSSAVDPAAGLEDVPRRIDGHLATGPIDLLRWTSNDRPAILAV